MTFTRVLVFVRAINYSLLLFFFLFYLLLPMVWAQWSFLSMGRREFIEINYHRCQRENFQELKISFCKFFDKIWEIFIRSDLFETDGLDLNFLFIWKVEFLLIRRFCDFWLALAVIKRRISSVFFNGWFAISSFKGRDLLDSTPLWILIGTHCY